MPAKLARLHAQPTRIRESVVEILRFALGVCAPPRYAAEQIDLAGVTTAVGKTSWPLTDLESVRL